MIVSHMEEMGLMMLLALPVWAAIRLITWKIRGKKLRWSREVLLAVFVLFLVTLAQQTVFPRFVWENGRLLIKSWNINGCNYIPLYTISRFWRYGTPAQIGVNLVGNVVMFLPLGLLPALLWRKVRPVVTGVGLGVLTSVLIELVQPLVGRSRDVDDLILNTLGAGLGCLLARLLLRGGINYD